MDASLISGTDALSDVGSSSFHDLLNSNFGGADHSNSQCCSLMSDLFNEPINASSFHEINDSIHVSSVPPDQICKLQPRVYNRSPSLILSYTPPPSAKIVQLHFLPPQPQLPADVSAPLLMPSHQIAADLAAAPIIDMHAMPSHFLHADDVSAPHPHVRPPNMPPPPHISMPPQQPPPAYPNFNTHQLDACPNLMCCPGSQSHDPHHNFSFSFPDVEAKHKNQLPFDLLHDRSTKLTVSMHHPYLPDSRKLGLPKFEVPTSPIGCVTMSGTASPPYMQSSPFSTVDKSDSAAREMSLMSNASAPAAQARSNSSFCRTSTPSEKRSSSVPPSPTPSVNKKSGHQSQDKVAIKVKTKLLDLQDGFTWKKYGEKIIKKQKYPRSYLKCDKDRSGCEVLKRTQRCSDEEDYIEFTYIGRHNHHP